MHVHQMQTGEAGSFALKFPSFAAKTRVLHIPGGSQAFDHSKQDVSVQTALVSLVQDDDRILVQLIIVQALAQECAICE